MRKLTREPLIHFLVLGALVFAINGWRQRHRPATTETARIEVTARMIARLSEGFANQWHRAPDAAELRGMVSDHVREEVLYREALALGLDANDTIVRRRLAQKMEFLGQDIATALPPNEIALRKFFEENAVHYAKAARLSFQHIYFSKEKRGDRLEPDARAALAALANGASDESVGDPFLREHEFSDANEIEISSALGRDFAAQIMTLPAGGWRGPVPSSYGVHLVRVSHRSEPQAVEFASVRDAVVRDFSEVRRIAANNDFISRLKERYLISVDDQALADATRPSVKTAAK